jgi:hypothetical protein
MKLVVPFGNRHAVVASSCVRGALGAASKPPATTRILRLVGARFFAFLFPVLFAQPACAFLDKLSELFGSEPYPVIHSKYAAEDQGATYRLSWLDNDRLLFVGEPIAEVSARFDKKSSAKRRNLRFYIWNTQTNQVQAYKEVGEWGRFCYNEVDNFVRYLVPGRKDALMEGEFGTEREVKIDPAEHTPEGRAKRGVFFQDLTCREYQYASKDSGVLERWVFPLHRDHGILDVRGKQSGASSIKLFSSDYKRNVALPLVRRAIAPEKIYYSKYRKVYVLTGYTAPPSYSNNWGSWPAGVGQPVFTLSPNGVLTRAAEIPWRDEAGAALAVFLTVKGLVYVAGRPKEHRGFFLVKNGTAIPLMKVPGTRFISAAGVSPNGCKVAGAISMEVGSDTGGVKVVDLCGGRRDEH